MQDMGEIMAELTRNNSPSEPSSAEGSAAVRGTSAVDSVAVRGNPRGAEPTAVLQISAAAATAGGGARGATAGARETTFREDALPTRDAEELLFLSRLAQPGVSQISKGGLENGGHTPAVRWG